MVRFKGVSAQSGIFSKLFILLGAAFLFTMLALFSWTVLIGGNSTETGSLKILQLFQSVGMFVVPPLVLAYFCSEKPFAYLQLDRKINWSNAAFVMLIMLLAIPFINLLSDLNQQMVLPKAFSGIENWMKVSEEQSAQLTENFLNVHNLQGLLFNIFLVALLPALGEELFFRGALQTIFKDWRGAIVAVWMTAAIFSAIHFQFYGFVPRMLLGAFFGYILIWSENLWLTIIAHFCNNVITVIFYYLKNNGYQTINIDTIGTGNTLWAGCASGLLVIIGIIILKKRLQNQNSDI